MALKRDSLKLAGMLRAAGNEKRLQILCSILGRRKMCVSDLAAGLRMSVAVTSHHLQAMEKAGLLRAVKDGKCVYYSFAEQGIASDVKGLICKYI